MGMRRVKREMGEGDGVIEGSKTEWRDGHEDGNLKGQRVRCQRVETKK